MHRPLLTGLLGPGLIAPGLLIASAAIPLAQQPLPAQETPPGLSRGFDNRAPVVATAEEIAQGQLWVLEVDFKPMRLVRVETTNPVTGEKKEELVWYLVYRARNKPLATPPQEEEKIPVNNFDPPPGPSLLVPEFELITDDNNVQTVHQDRLVAEAQAAIVAREMRGADAKRTLKNNVQVVQPIPEASADGEAVYGVAMWTGIDPSTDNFRVFASGFSNGYQEVPGPDGKPLIRRREILLNFWSPGDEFDLTEKEFRLREEPKWIYRADDVAPAENDVNTPVDPEA